jgi:hypothetical protein
LPSRWWWSSWSVSAGMFFLELFCGGIVSFFRLTHGRRQCWGYPKIRMGSPNTKERTVGTFKYSNDTRGDKESPQRLLKPQKLWMLLHVPSRPLF